MEHPLVRNPAEYTVVGRVPLAVVNHAAFCEHCKNPVYDRAVYGRDPALHHQARRGWVVLTDAMYLVHGPDGERPVRRPCVQRCAFRRHNDADDSEAALWG
jgi:hypothetical protein